MGNHGTSDLLRRLLSRRSVLVTGAAAATLPAAALGTVVAGNPPPARAAGATRRVTLYAEALPGGLYGYGLAPGQATVPGPVLEMYEGDTLEVTLVNNTAERLSIHPHGVDYSVDSDGSPLHNSFNRPGETRTYTWRSREMFPAPGRRFMPGSAGYWHYHDHAMTTDHGSGGIARGLYGALIVRRRGDLLPDRQFTVVFNDMMINNRVAPNAPMFEANLGQRVEWIAIGHGGTFHTFHLHAHRWADNRTGMLESTTDPSQVIDNKDLNPGSSFGFQVLAGEGVGPGAWMYHCHVQFHSDGGMVGIFLVRNADGSMPPGAQEAIDKYHGHAHAAQAARQQAQHGVAQPQFVAPPEVRGPDTDHAHNHGD